MDMLISQILDNYEKEYPIYKAIDFSHGKKHAPEYLHPLFVLTQYIIDSSIEKGNKRVAVVLPDNECNIIPMLLAKYFANIQHISGYAGSVLDEIEIGQHIRLGKAVVEFQGLIKDEKDKRAKKINAEGTFIEFKTGRKDQTTFYCPLNGVHFLFEKTNGAISSYKIWKQAEKEALEKLKSGNTIVSELKLKRTVLKKTICLLSAKNDFNNYINELRIGGQSFEDVVSYGEIDIDNSQKFTLNNKGKLDCLPSVTVATKLSDIYALLRDESCREKIYAIYSTLDKFDEVTDNPDTLKKVLKKDVPFIVFVPESSFENIPLLSEFGFDIWHWKPSTMKSEALLAENINDNAIKDKPMFGVLSRKINKAVFSQFTQEVCVSNELKKNTRLIKALSQLTIDSDNNLRQLVRKIWNYQRKLAWLVCEIKENLKAEMMRGLEEIQNLWNTQKDYYSGQRIETIINEIMRVFYSVISIERPEKFLVLEKYLKGIPDGGKKICLLLPDKYPQLDQINNYFAGLREKYNISVKAISQFYSEQEKSFNSWDYLIVTWFDKDEYIRIKQTYCYDCLAFVLYDFESKWREQYVRRFDECVSHDVIKRTACKVGFSESDIMDLPFDKVFIESDKEFEEISDYNFSNTIIRSTFGNIGKDKDRYSVDSIESIPVLLTEDKIAYFYPTHEVIDITLLFKGVLDRPVRKEAGKLKKGDKILIRQSGKDIIREKADILMSQNKESDLRQKAEIWVKLLNIYAENKTITDVYKAINNEGAECTFQQVRYWLSGETIMPRDKDILIAIGKIASHINELHDLSQDYLRKIDIIYNAGKKVQSYHQSAGHWLNRELKSRASEIIDIARREGAQGSIEEIGEIKIYTVEDVLNKEITSRGRINRLEDLY